MVEKASMLSVWIVCVKFVIGVSSNTLIDPCTLNPCLNGGICHYESVNYSCDCPVGFSGINCGQRRHRLLVRNSSEKKFVANVDPCTRSPCIHGSCVASGTRYTCTCNAGYGGQLCDKPVDTCSLTCQNGYCLPTFIPGQIQCVCDSGFTGLNCDTPITPSLCMPNPCLHGGTCTLTDDGYAYQCACISGYRGHNCQYSRVGCSQSSDCDVKAFSACPDSDYFCQSGTCECLQ